MHVNRYTSQIYKTFKVNIMAGGNHFNLYFHVPSLIQKAKNVSIHSSILTLYLTLREETGTSDTFIWSQLLVFSSFLFSLFTVPVLNMISYHCFWKAETTLACCSQLWLFFFLPCSAFYILMRLQYCIQKQLLCKVWYFSCSNHLNFLEDECFVIFTCSAFVWYISKVKVINL